MIAAQTSSKTEKKAEKGNVSVRLLHENELATADQIMRLAFGTFMGLADPASFMGDADFVRTRWRADPAAAFAAEIDNEVVGSNFATNWGSVGFFGPLTIRPDLWDKGLGRRLMEPVVDCFDRWQSRHVGLFTFAHSPKHVGLYQKFGFFPRFLTAIMSKPVEATAHTPTWTKFSDAMAEERDGLLDACRELTDAVYEGLDTKCEIKAVADQNLGDTIFLWEGSELSGFAVCHSGAGSEAGSATCYVKFGVTRPGASAERDFNRLLYACEEFSAAQSASRLLIGVNTARENAYRQALARGFRADLLGLSMARPNEAGYNRSDVYLIDDWR
jgi:predicted N-acetyltransferase YhbS